MAEGVILDAVGDIASGAVHQRDRRTRPAAAGVRTLVFIHRQTPLHEGPRPIAHVLDDFREVHFRLVGIGYKAGVLRFKLTHGGKHVVDHSHHARRASITVPSDAGDLGYVRLVEKDILRIVAAVPIVVVDQRLGREARVGKRRQHVRKQRRLLIRR